MLSSTEGNWVSALILGSHGCLFASAASCSPFEPGLSRIHRAASTTWVGYVAAARIWPTNASGYRAIGATNCCKFGVDSEAGGADCGASAATADVAIATESMAV